MCRLLKMLSIKQKKGTKAQQYDDTRHQSTSLHLNPLAEVCPVQPQNIILQRYLNFPNFK